MCGRYYRRSDKQRIAEAFKVGKLPPGFELPPDYNIAPSTYQPVIRADVETGERELVMMLVSTPSGAHAEETPIPR
jgi:putative SOS response-associated peptidase YedK